MTDAARRVLARIRPLLRPLGPVKRELLFRADLVRRGGVLGSAAHAAVEALATERHPVVDLVVLGDPAAAEALRGTPRARVHLLGMPSESSATAPDAAPTMPLAEIHRAIRLVPRLGMIVDGLGADEQDRRLRQLLYYLLPDGRYVIPRPAAATSGLLAELDAIRRKPGFTPDSEGPPKRTLGVGHRAPEGPIATSRLAAAVQSRRTVSEAVVLQKRLHHLLKVREIDMSDDFLRARMQGWTREVVVAPAETVTELSPLTLNRPDLRGKFPTAFAIPRMALRTYEDVSCAPRQIAFRDEILLPDALRLASRPYPEQIFMRDVDARFVRLPHRYGRLPVLEGSYYYLDDEHPDVYGHLLTDMSGRLWGWERALQEDPDLKLLVSTPARSRSDLPGWMQTMLEAYGIERTRLHALTRPARVERLYGATPQFVNFSFGYAAPAIAEVWDRWRDRVLAARPVPETPRKVFVSRPPGGTRECRNAAEVEAFFADAGFAVIRPEEHDLHTQVALFANAERLAGFGGSAMLNAIFRGRDRRMLVLQPESHHAVNEFLIASVYGDPVTQHYSRAEVAGKATGNALYQSPFTVDLAGDGELLREFAAA